MLCLLKDRDVLPIMKISTKCIHYGATTVMCKLNVYLYLLFLFFLFLFYAYMCV